MMKKNALRTAAALAVAAVMLLHAAAPVCAAEVFDPSKTVVAELLTPEYITMFRSQTNPPVGTKTVSPARPAVNGFQWADFGTYNSYAKDNGLKGAPVYLTGIVTAIIPSAYLVNPGVSYGVIDSLVVIQDPEGHQWLCYALVVDSRFSDFVTNVQGHVTAIYGTYAGYSDDFRMPVMDASVYITAEGANAVANPYF